MTTKHRWENSAMMQAVRCLPTEKIPIWLMRQAGRYMPEYRAMRQRVGFLELCKTPALAAEVMLTAVEQLKVDAAIIFSDILLILEPMGLGLEFLPEGGPRITKPITVADDVAKICELHDESSMEFVMDVVKYTREGLDDHLPLIGFAGAPFTLAAYAIEGGASRDFQKVKAFMRLHPYEWADLMKKIALSTARYLNGQINAGVQIVQLFDSWVGTLSEEEYREYAMPYTKMIFDLVSRETPMIHFAPGNPMLLPAIREAGGHVIGVDWRLSIAKAWEMIGADCAIQGNLDPSVLLTTPETIRKHVQKILHHVDHRPGFVFNLGHGVLSQTPVENVKILIETVHEFCSRAGEPAGLTHHIGENGPS